MLAVAALLSGLALGMVRLRVISLLPAGVVAIVAGVALAHVSGASAFVVVGLCLIALQAGYVVGLFVPPAHQASR